MVIFAFIAGGWATSAGQGGYGMGYRTGFISGCAAAARLLPTILMAHPLKVSGQRTVVSDEVGALRQLGLSL